MGNFIEAISMKIGRSVINTITNTYSYEKLEILKIILLCSTFALSQGLPVQAGRGSDSLLVNQQTLTVSGTVVDLSGDPIIGADVMYKGTTVCTSTDLNGRFSLAVPGPGTVSVSYVSLKTFVQFYSQARQSWLWLDGLDASA
jgi:hypothetical protein